MITCYEGLASVLVLKSGFCAICDELLPTASLRNMRALGYSLSLLVILVLPGLARSQVFSLAPMMEYTDRHMRYLLRLLTTRTVLWTEMVPASTIIHNPDDLGRFLDYNEEVEHPVVLQVPTPFIPHPEGQPM